MNIVVVGLGVIGGSFAKALKKAGYEDVFGVDIDSETLKKAEELKIIKKGCTTGKEFFKQADLIILSIYPRLIVNFLENNKEFFKKGTIITDTTGIKEVLINDVLKIIPDDVDFIFGHPMAGREKKGIDFASDEVFKKANYIITPTGRNNIKNLEFVENLILEIGFKRVKKLTAQKHDEMIAFTSQLPHVMAVALINSDEEGRDTGKFIGDSYRDLTRIANMNEDLWSELFLGNRDNLLKCIENFEIEVNLIKEAIFNNDKNKLVEYFKTSSIRREHLEK
ncbi:MULTISPECIES: prephenate dehydrogenase [unclassified Clostridioides]|uniref:prephenate dehydrogenase n=1 Tax=unclassified Clostridioides TaxID=2635829 RepID=UPI001D0FCEF5|nr:prephenate dehydrogenase [Clostridioides sp. ZZV14-6150]MCC0667838.1 prephenate dehydrogenase [Clostridioides sp. ZZV14-6153]MCC0723650.1 prephenate dehydrogenase [Clostridioides sp. ZZV14-6104]MCC0728308.1 prephenate dehydrogenase [Clostridioides sp. ZZV14-6045]MCC0732303.1 prephenate dehydrogenase [Clostridioides sp. ZZV14-6048]MCC0734636.1 prephenate dehydrogenase [Clostridioides sp. ZZV14-6009]MCC0738605.1 prephenate dehydrogenase [Clostridioides sp. ZZV14-5902]MCC0741529.1 prephenate